MLDISKDDIQGFWIADFQHLIGWDDFFNPSHCASGGGHAAGTKPAWLHFPAKCWSCCSVWPQWEGKNCDAWVGFLCAFQLYSVLEDENTPEYPEEQGQFSPGVNSKESLQETLEMDCRMESLSPSLLRPLFFATVYIPSSDTGLFALLMESCAGVKEVAGSI